MSKALLGFGAFLVVTSGWACTERPPEERVGSRLDTASSLGPAERPGTLFDPSAAQPGWRIGTLVLRSISAQRAVDSSWVGRAVFTGAITLNGKRIAHSEPDQLRLPCFEADSASASRLPRWKGDNRRTWFCFANDSVGTRAWKNVPDEVSVSIVIDDFTIHRGLSDQVNTARLVRVIR